MSLLTSEYTYQVAVETDPYHRQIENANINSYHVALFVKMFNQFKKSLVNLLDTLTFIEKDTQYYLFLWLIYTCVSSISLNKFS